MAKTIQDRSSITDVDEAIFDELLDERIYEIHTSHPATVISINGRPPFNGKERTVTVRLGIRRDMKGLSKKIAPLIHVPVLFPSSKNYGMTWPVEVGDTGLVVFSESSIDQWWEGSGSDVVNPRDMRMHHYSDGFFIPHVMQKLNALSADEIKDGEVVIKSKETKLTLKEDGTFCLETEHGEFLETLVKALGLINTSSGGVATAEIATLLKMVCK